MENQKKTQNQTVNTPADQPSNKVGSNPIFPTQVITPSSNSTDRLWVHPQAPEVGNSKGNSYWMMPEGTIMKMGLIMACTMSVIVEMELCALSQTPGAAASSSYWAAVNEITVVPQWDDITNKAWHKKSFEMSYEDLNLAGNDFAVQAGGLAGFWVKKITVKAKQQF